MDQAYQDKLDGTIPLEFWDRKMLEWTEDEKQIHEALLRLTDPNPSQTVDAKRILELANKAYSLYLRQDHAEQAKLLRMVLLNCLIDSATVQPAYRNPFDLIFQRARKEEWSGRADLNCRPLAPQASALPG